MEIDIRYGGSRNNPFDILSNLAPKLFTFRGVRTKTIEGILQSTKVYSIDEQAKFWEMNGFEAKKAGKNINWWDSQILWWNQEPMDRHGPEYQEFLDELFGQCFGQCWAMQAMLDEAAKMEYTFAHSIGGTDPERTILTQEEFLSRLHILRDLKKAP